MIGDRCVIDVEARFYVEEKLKIANLRFVLARFDYDTLSTVRGTNWYR